MHTNYSRQDADMCALPGREELPVELCADLPDARIAGAGHLSEVCVVDVPVRVSKLRMVEYIEKLHANVEGEILMDYRSLHYAEIGVVKTGSVEKTPVRSAERP